MISINNPSVSISSCEGRVGCLLETVQQSYQRAEQRQEVGDELSWDQGLVDTGGGTNLQGWRRVGAGFVPGQTLVVRGGQILHGLVH